MHEKVSFRRFSQGEGEDERHFLIMCKLSEDDRDFEDSTIDLFVSAAHKSWTAQGLKKPKSPHAEAFRRIHTALTSRQHPDIAFKVQFTEKPDSLQVVCAWKDKGKEVFQRHQPFELQADSADNASTHIHDALIERCEILQDTSNCSSGRVEELQKLAEDSQHLVREYVEKHSQREKEMYLKFAAVLNEKKKRIRELERELAAHRQGEATEERGGTDAKQGWSPSQDTAASEPQTDSPSSNDGAGTEDGAEKGQAVDAENDGEESHSDVDHPNTRAKRRKKAI